MTVAASKRKRNPPKPPRGMLSIAEAARRLGVSPRTVGRYIAGRQLEYGVYPSGRRMVTAESVSRFMGNAVEGRL